MADERTTRLAELIEPFRVKPGSRVWASDFDPRFKAGIKEKKVHPENLGAGAVMAHALMDIDPQFPEVSKQQRAALGEVRKLLEAQAPSGAPADPFRAGSGATART